MGTILSLLRKVEAVNTDKIVVDTMEESKEVLADLNAEQINTGLKSDGKLMPNYSQTSVNVYGKTPGPIKLRDTGDWQAGIYVTIQGNDVLFDSTDSKTAMLVEGNEYGGGYGENIFGLSEKYKAEAMREKVRPVFRGKIELATGLKFK